MAEVAVVRGIGFDVLTASRALLVVGQPQGFRIQLGDIEGSWLPVGLAELLVLQGLVRSPGVAPDGVVREAAARTGTPIEDLVAFVTALVDASLLLPTSPRPAAMPGVEGPVERFAAGAPPVDDDGRYVMLNPVVLRPTADGYTWVDHDGRSTTVMTADEVHVAHLLLDRPSMAGAEDAHRAAGGTADVRAVTSWLVARGLAAPVRPDTVDSAVALQMRSMLQRKQRLANAVAKAIDAHEQAEVGRSRPSGGPRIKVHPVDTTGRAIPLSLGLIVAYAKAYQGGALEQDFQFVPSWLVRGADLAALQPEPAVYLYSNYIWTHPHNLRASAAAKAANPLGVNVHGGPDSPKYDADCEHYFRVNPHIDVVVHGEGEETAAAMLAALAGAWDATGGGPPDLDALAEVPGLSFRRGDRVVHTGHRDRLADLDVIPSPFLTGLFEPFAEAGVGLGLLETNRGCPYGCTFCDWGSATASRIRKFDLERVFAEIEWYGRIGADRIFLADANFGIFERDVEVAEKVAEVKATYGAPLQFQTNYAKNTVKHLHKIVQTLGDAGILTTGLLSLQSMDADTLSTVKRSNIKTEKYDDLAREFRRLGLPLFVDLMVGMPGSTPRSFQADLQGCVDREVSAKVYKTELLVNSPMNEPGYKAANQIRIAARDDELVKSTTPEGTTPRPALVVSTASYTRAEYDEMMELRLAHLATENLGALRHVTRFVRQETGVEEVELVRRALRDATADPDRWPMLWFVLRVVSHVGVAPGSWRWFVDEVRAYLLEQIGVEPSPALETALTVQHALLPTRGRHLPLEVPLAHDYVAWWSAIRAEKEAGWHDWPARAPRLGDLPPGTLVVDDRHQVCERALGDTIAESHLIEWELDSPLARPMSHQHLTYS